MFYSCVQSSDTVVANTLASKSSELIRNAAIVRKRRVIHKTLTCVCLRLAVAAITRKRRNASVDLWPACGFLSIMYAELVKSWWLFFNHSQGVHKPTCTSHVKRPSDEAQSHTNSGNIHSPTIIQQHVHSASCNNTCTQPHSTTHTPSLMQ